MTTTVAATTPRQLTREEYRRALQIVYAAKHHNERMMAAALETKHHAEMLNQGHRELIAILREDDEMDEAESLIFDSHSDKVAALSEALDRLGLTVAGEGLAEGTRHGEPAEEMP
jgi:hypothetical protein